MERKAGEKCAKRLCDAFWTVLERKPYARIAVSDVLSESEVSRGDFYYHYRNLADLARSAVEEEVGKWEDLFILLSQIGEGGPEEEAGSVVRFLSLLSGQNSLKAKRLSTLVSANSSMQLVTIFQEGLKSCLAQDLGMRVSCFTPSQKVAFEGLAGLVTSLVVHAKLLKCMDRSEIENLAVRLDGAFWNLKRAFVSPASGPDASRRVWEP